MSAIEDTTNTNHETRSLVKQDEGVATGMIGTDTGVLNLAVNARASIQIISNSPSFELDLNAF